MKIKAGDRKYFLIKAGLKIITRSGYNQGTVISNNKGTIEVRWSEESDFAVPYSESDVSYAFKMGIWKIFVEPNDILRSLL